MTHIITSLFSGKKLISYISLPTFWQALEASCSEIMLDESCWWVYTN